MSLHSVDAANSDDAQSALAEVVPLSGENAVSGDDLALGAAIPGEVGYPGDAALLARLRKVGVDSEEGRRLAAELYARHYDTVMARAYRMTSDRYRAEDHAAEAFAKTLRAMKGGRGPKDSFVGYVLIAMRTEVIRAVPHEVQTQQMDMEELLDLPQLMEADHAGRLSERDHLLRAFRTLPGLQQRALYLLEVEARSIDEAANELGTNPVALRALSYRARESLRVAYLQQYVDDARPECVPVASLLAGYTRDGLRKRQAKLVREHLSWCVACSSQVQVLTQINSRLRAWLGPLLVGGGAGAVVGGGGVDQAAAASRSPGEVVDAVRDDVSNRVWWWLMAGTLLVLGIGIWLTLVPSDGRLVPASIMPNPAVPAEEYERSEAEPQTTEVPYVQPDLAPPPGVPELAEDDATPFWKLRE